MKHIILTFMKTRHKNINKYKFMKTCVNKCRKLIFGDYCYVKSQRITQAVPFSLEEINKAIHTIKPGKASTETLKTSINYKALALVYSAAEYAAPVWLNSAYCSKIDVQLNSTMRIITGVVKTRWLLVLCNIHPPNITATAREWSKYTHNVKLPILKDTPMNCTLRLKSRKPVCLLVKDLIENQFNGRMTGESNFWSIFW